MGLFGARPMNPTAGGLDPVVGFLDQLEASDGDRAGERDQGHHVFERLLVIVQPDFSPTT